MKITEKQIESLKYVKNAKPLVGSSNRACPLSTARALAKKGLISQEFNTSVCFGIHWEITPAGLEAIK